ncbi:MAG: M48 family metallopeptidase, partial [Verrucomicrobiota bacterium]
MDSAPPSAMGFTFPPSPESVPPDLAKPTSKYRLHAWLAFCGLTLFGLIYLTLVLWFGYSTFRLFGEATEQGGFLLFIESFGAAILTIFLVKGLFFKKHSQVDNSYEVTKEDEPVLFAFLNQLAADVGAPRPHKVFLSPTVNACVFYDLSLLNFLIPTKKNLDIGLGLVNVLTLSEFKAVLSHEFGHFA